MDSATIVVGYGNIDRADDGVAFAVINELRGRLGRIALEEGDTGLDALDGQRDTVFLPQLLPEIMELLTAYDNIIFVDAHVGPGMEDLHCSPVTPHYSPSAFTHHMTPSALLAFMGAAYGREPRAHLVSILGHDFGLQGTISPKTRALVGPAVDLILDLMGQEDDR